MMTEEAFAPAVDPAIWRLRPDFVALSIVIRDGRNAPSDERTGPGVRAAIVPGGPPWGAAHLDAWRAAYTAFGAKPKRTPCSAEALCRRAERDAALPRINAIVDLYNALSVRYALPIGGENLAAYRGTPRLVRAQGGERFETVRDGEPSSEAVEPGEVVWRDDAGVTCRRWNWRQSVRTRLDVGTTDMWFVLERLDPMPLEALHEAGEALVAAVVERAPSARVTRTVLRA